MTSLPAIDQGSEIDELDSIASSETTGAPASAVQRLTFVDNLSTTSVGSNPGLGAALDGVDYQVVRKHMLLFLVPLIHRICRVRF
jgi:hypothetical protein